jgi:hypothetical protein
MRYRIAGWASAGFLIVGCWAVYFAEVSRVRPIEPIVNILVRITCPIALLSFYPLTFYLVLIANAATYALLGLIVEALRRQLRHAS